jgi:hypothetical protein
MSQTGQRRQWSIRHLCRPEWAWSASGVALRAGNFERLINHPLARAAMAGFWIAVRAIAFEAVRVCRNCECALSFFTWAETAGWLRLLLLLSYDPF